MSRNNKEILAARLFSPRSSVESQLSPDELETKARWSFIMTQKLDDPMVSNKKIIELLKEGVAGSWHRVSQATAYNDIAAVNEILGNVRQASKTWMRYTIVEGAKLAYAIAQDKGDAYSMAKALDVLGKYSRADKDDDAIELQNILPPVFEPSDDVTLLEGITPLANLEQRRQELRRLFKGSLHDIEDAQEVKEDDDEE